MSCLKPFIWHLAKKGAPTQYVPQKADDEEKIKKEQAIIDQMLEPYQFTYASAMNVCDSIQYYRDHKDEQDENDRMCLQLFGIRYLKNNRNSKTGALARLNTQCGDMLFTKWKSDASYGIADMGKNFYRLASKETEPFLQDIFFKRAAA